MAWSKPFSEEEDEFVREHFGQLTNAEIAAALNRSERAIYYAINRLGLRASRPRASCRPEELEHEGADGNLLMDLMELRKVLRTSMLEAGPHQLPRLAHEYRETLDQIERVRNGGSDVGDGNADDALGDIFALVPLGR